MTIQMTSNPRDPIHGCRWSARQASHCNQMETEATSSPSTETNAAAVVDNNSGFSHNPSGPNNEEVSNNLATTFLPHMVSVVS